MRTSREKNEDEKDHIVSQAHGYTRKIIIISSYWYGAAAASPANPRRRSRSRNTQNGAVQSPRAALHDDAVALGAQR